MVAIEDTNGETGIGNSILNSCGTRTMYSERQVVGPRSLERMRARNPRRRVHNSLSQSPLDYAGPMFSQPGNSTESQSDDLSHESMASQDLARKSVSNRFYNFFAGSRSRSSSRSRKPDVTFEEPPVPPPHARHRPIPSRPLSSTTTATNTTITPRSMAPTPRASRAHAHPVALAPIAPPSNDDDANSIPSNPPTPRRKFVNLFGMVLSISNPLGSRKSSFGSNASSRANSRSRPATPGNVPDVPPLPDLRRTLLEAAAETPRPLRMEPPNSLLQPETQLLSRNSSVSSSSSNRFRPAARLFGSRNEHTDQPAVQIVRSPSPMKKAHSHSTSIAAPSSLTPRHTRRGSNDLYTSDSEFGVIHFHRDAHSTNGRSRERPRTREESTGRERALQHINKKTSLSRETRHGSFDFERPGWGSMASSNLGRSNSRQSARSPSPWQGGGGVKVDAAPSLSSNTKRPTLVIDSGSLGRANGKRAGPGLGLFPFEPPVSPGPSVPPSPSSHDTTSSSNHDARLHPLRGRDRRARHFDAEDDFAELHGRNEYDFEKEQLDYRKQHDVPESRPLGYRSAARGRSLDLGLGFSWAPSRVREEALLPEIRARAGGAVGLGRTMSNGGPSRRYGRSIGRQERISEERDVITIIPERMHNVKAGKDIADVFQNVLDQEGYARFKKYVRWFDAKDIPFDGPNGIIAHVQQLLDGTHLQQGAKQTLIDGLVEIILQNA
ncbi:hypothetical protein FISHEDRAFT_58308 [Fistulina hepatica ATCC 64428]|nr:hypothetical protein FISHEDRAFT_58308 [Fistulina hepatica ATCC 64428]